MKDLHFNRDFIKIDLVQYEVTSGYRQYPGVCIVNLDSINVIAKSNDSDFYTLHIDHICYYITEEQFGELCEKL